MTAVTEEVVISFSKIAGALRVTPEELLEHVFGAMPATPTSPEELMSRIADYKVWFEDGRPGTLHGTVAFLKLLRHFVEERKNVLYVKG